MKFLKYSILFFSFLLLNASVFGQSINSYKYIVVPNQFNFQNSAHQYNLNRLTEFLFNKYKFEAFIQGEKLPVGYEPCKALQIDAFKKGSFKTYAHFTFRDCFGKTIYTSKKGESRLKEFDKAYTEAVRNIFNDPIIKRHKYIAVEKPAYTKAAITKTDDFTNTAITTTTSKIKTVATVPQARAISYEFQSKKYTFSPIENGYSIITNKLAVGTALKQANDAVFTVTAGSLSGKGSFDDFGNFILKRINPVNKKEIIDIFARTN